MAAGGNSQTGCVLPEDLRRYYLDTMGVQLWQPIQAEAPFEAEAEARVHDQAGAVPPKGGQSTWQQIEQAVSACTRCDLHSTRTQAVFGVGSHDADLLIIGEAPGRDEDLQGEPFVGRAGQLLNAMLAAIGYRREQVYIANILKCRPPNNRDPRPDEAEACNPWLQKQIELVQPAVILALGRIAAQNLLNTDRSLGALRTGQHKYAGIPLIVTYHPAYLLRKPIDKRKSWQDLKRVKMLLNEDGHST